MDVVGLLGDKINENAAAALLLAPRRPIIPFRLHLYTDGSAPQGGNSVCSWAAVLVGEDEHGLAFMDRFSGRPSPHSLGVFRRG